MFGTLPEGREMAEHTIKRIETIERLHNSTYGNPRFAFTFSDGTQATSMSDAAFCYAVGNPGMRSGDTVVLEFTRAGRIRHMGPYER
jgi:hypothetical protein